MKIHSLSPPTQQLLPLFAYFHSAISIAEELIDEYLLLLWQSEKFPNYSFHLFFPMVEELQATGWWKRAQSGYAIIAMNPLLQYQIIQRFKFLPAIQQETIQDCFIEYYKKIIIPKSIRPYLSAPNVEARQLGVFVTQYEAENLERCILLASTKGVLNADLYAMVV